MNDVMVHALKALFEQHRIVFWYCDDPLLVADYEAVTLEGVEKRDITGRLFRTKVEVLHEQPKTKFLLFHRGPRPADEENFLLDVLLANKEFLTDKASLVAAELGLGEKLLPALRATMPFFAAAARTEAVKALLAPKDETPTTLVEKMLAVVLGTQPKIEAILLALFKKPEVWTSVEKFGLAPFFWQQLRATFGYVSETPSLADFKLALFGDAVKGICGESGSVRLSSAARAFLESWRDHAKFREVFDAASDEAARNLGVASALRTLAYDRFGAEDVFAEIDRRILRELAARIEARTIRHEEVARLVAERQNTHWFDSDFAPHYRALERASSFWSQLAQFDFQPATPDEAIRSYVAVGAKLDGAYRAYTVHAQTVKRSSDLLDAITGRLNGDYANNFLYKMNNAFQKTLEGVSTWPFETSLLKQREFWRSVVCGRYADKKVCVIISDALRYGVAEELADRFRAADRYTAKLEPMVGMLPSYTQLGMAALLPHEKLHFGIPHDGRVMADGRSTAGLEARQAILAAADPKGATAVRAEDVLSWTRAELDACTHDHHVIYVYHNVIDAAGDDAKTEGETCAACARAMDDIVALVKKLAGPSHVSSFLVTSDHGFLYQDAPVEASDFIPPPRTADVAAASKLTRRFYLGRGFELRTDLMRFTERELGLSGDALVAIPKSTLRMRLSGSGSRYTHGGASLQEITIPLLTIVKKRLDDTAAVEVDLLREGINKITTANLVVRFYQTAPVGGKVLPRTLRARLMTQDGRIALSSAKEMVFNSPGEAAGDRIQTLTLALSHEADKLGNASVDLVIETRLPGTSQYVPYRKETYQLQRMFERDF